MKKTVFALILLLISSSVFGDLTIDYIDGYLDLRVEEEWIQLDVGEKIPNDSVIRLDEDSIAELSGSGMKLVLTRPETYKLEDLVRVFDDRKAFVDIVGDKIKNIMSESRQAQTAVMGVRGAKKTYKDFEWMYSNSEELLIEGIDFFQAKEYGVAVEVLWEAVDLVDSYEIQTLQLIHLLLGMSYSQIDKYELATEHFEHVIELDQESESGNLARNLIVPR